MLPAAMSSPTTRANDDDVIAVTSQRLTAWAQEHQQFHQHGTFFAIWLLVMFVGVEILAKARSILEPILWAFFLMMGLVPLTDMFERWLLAACSLCGCFRKRRRQIGTTCSRSRLESLGSTAGAPRQPAKASCLSPGARRHIAAEEAMPYAPMQKSTSQTLSTASGRVASRGAAVEDDSGSDKDFAEAHNDSDEQSATSGEEDVGAATVAAAAASASCKQGGWVRTVAVLLVIILSLGFSVLFFVMVYKSAEHMQESWPHYTRGARNIANRLEQLLDRLPDEMVQKYTNKALASTESALVELVNGILEATSHTVFDIVWVLLYMVFWLCQPVHIDKDVSAVFKRYIFLKGFASGGYAFCIWLLLHMIGVDLAIVFGLVTFVFNFIPEVGPFIAMMLPLPVILFDDRMTAPFQCMLLALIGQLSLKVIFGNVVEIKLIESQQEMKMHPVVILFFVAFFQYIWGATGMLLSVPIVAALKATLHKVPPAYRNPILIFLEGDKVAPAKWRAWRESLEEDTGVVPVE